VKATNRLIEFIGHFRAGFMIGQLRGRPLRALFEGWNRHA
jgi:hypothetical protein